MALRHLVGVILMVGLSPVVLGLQCKTDLDEPSDGWVLFRGNGLTYHYYDLSKTTNVQVRSEHSNLVHCANNNFIIRPFVVGAKGHWSSQGGVKQFI